MWKRVGLPTRFSFRKRILIFNSLFQKYGFHNLNEIKLNEIKADDGDRSFEVQRTVNSASRTAGSHRWTRCLTSV